MIQIFKLLILASLSLSQEVPVNYGLLLDMAKKIDQIDQNQKNFEHKLDTLNHTIIKVTDVEAQIEKQIEGLMNYDNYINESILNGAQKPHQPQEQDPTIQELGQLQRMKQVGKDYDRFVYNTPVRSTATNNMLVSGDSQVVHDQQLNRNQLSVQKFLENIISVNNRENYQNQDNHQNLQEQSAQNIQEAPFYPPKNFLNPQSIFDKNQKELQKNTSRDENMKLSNGEPFLGDVFQNEFTSQISPITQNNEAQNNNLNKNILHHLDFSSRQALPLSQAEKLKKDKLLFPQNQNYQDVNYKKDDLQALKVAYQLPRVPSVQFMENSKKFDHPIPNQPQNNSNFAQNQSNNNFVQNQKNSDLKQNQEQRQTKEIPQKQRENNQAKVQFVPNQVYQKILEITKNNPQQPLQTVKPILPPQMNQQESFTFQEKIQKMAPKNVPLDQEVDQAQFTVQEGNGYMSNGIYSGYKPKSYPKVQNQQQQNQSNQFQYNVDVQQQGPQFDQNLSEQINFPVQKEMPKMQYNLQPNNNFMENEDGSTFQTNESYENYLPNQQFPNDTN